MQAMISKFTDMFYVTNNKNMLWEQNYQVEFSFLYGIEAPYSLTKIILGH